MPTFSVFDKTTGELLRTGECPDDWVGAQATCDSEQVFIGAFDAETSYFSDGKIKSRSPRPKNHIWNNEAQDWMEKSHHELYSDASDNIKIQRRYLLGMSDWTQLPDVPLATKEAWAIYRQALRDITGQPGYPLDVVWPTPPG